MLSMVADAKDSLPPLVEGRVPQGVDELWAGYDPRAEALDIKIIHEWDEIYQGRPLKVRMLSFTVGTFRGKVSRISAYYAYPADAKGKVPGLVQVHGGGHRTGKKGRPAVRGCALLCTLRQLKYHPTSSSSLCRAQDSQQAIGSPCC